MQILPIQNIRTSNENFKANRRLVFDKSGQELYKTTTYYFREDIDWHGIVQYLCGKFKNTEHVNFINHACSNGMEPLSFIMSFLINFPDKIDKFTPILAKDIDYDNIEAAKRGQCGVSSEDFLRICNHTKYRRNEFLEIKPSAGRENLFVMSPKKILTDRVIFQQGDIFEDVKNMPEENTFLSCRNFWCYLDKNKQEELAYLLGRHLKGNSTILIGYLDTEDAQNYNGNYANADKLLERNGFKRCQTGSKFLNIMYSKTD